MRTLVSAWPWSLVISAGSVLCTVQMCLEMYSLNSSTLAASCLAGNGQSVVGREGQRFHLVYWLPRLGECESFLVVPLSLSLSAFGIVLDRLDSIRLDSTRTSPTRFATRVPLATFATQPAPRDCYFISPGQIQQLCGQLLRQTHTHTPALIFPFIMAGAPGGNSRGRGGKFKKPTRGGMFLSGGPVKSTP